MRRGAALLAVVLSACGAEKAPHVVHKSYTAACQADTTTLKTQEETTHAMTNAYNDASSPLHKVTAAGATYTITIMDARCGVVGHTVGQTATDY
jgi:hypothetical protein